MPDQIPSREPNVNAKISPPVSSATEPQTSPSAAGRTMAGPTINIADEFGTAKRNLPPARIVMLAVGGVLVAAAIAVFLTRAKPQASGSLDNVTAIEIPGQSSTMVALTFTLRNSIGRILYVRGVQGALKTASGQFSADALSAVDFDRYFQAFPALRNGAQPALAPEDKLQPGAVTTRTVIVVFPVTLDVFNQRQSLSVVVQPYDQPVPVVLSK
jgi:hypothetical protein